MEKKIVRKHPFSVEEDRALMNYVRIYGASNWEYIASLMQGRTQKQCRERWNGHLCPSVNKGPWTLDEDIILAKKHGELGNKWAKIAQFLPGRTDILVKNRWNTSIKQRIQNGDLSKYLSGQSSVSSPAPQKKTFALPSMLQPYENYDIEKWLSYISTKNQFKLNTPSILVTGSF